MITSRYPNPVPKPTHALTLTLNHFCPSTVSSQVVHTEHLLEKVDPSEQAKLGFSAKQRQNKKRKAVEESRSPKDKRKRSCAAAAIARREKAAEEAKKSAREKGKQNKSVKAEPKADNE